MGVRNCNGRPIREECGGGAFHSENDEIQALASNGTDQPYESDAQADNEEEDGASDRFASGGTEDGHQETQKRPRETQRVLDEKVYTLRE